MRTLIIPVQIAGLWGFYELGSWVRDILQIPIPGSLLGMGILLTLLMTGVFPERWLAGGSEWLLGWLPLLFLPSIAGVVGVLPFLQDRGWELMIVVIVNTLLVMASSSLTSQWLVRRRAGGEESM
ncbi:holin-like protein [Marininema mesophilum]|uniref:Holin-like protein n=1 Tax=Marininema mesophilum TaxID=1048340 RepID=A0A1H3AS85_9BACL|nr:CidA/LrgA family protein [Marininema mesophilum]SDX32600.1 holin-like protein [Marininema mesophilum]